VIFCKEKSINIQNSLFMLKLNFLKFLLYFYWTEKLLNHTKYNEIIY